MHSKNNKGLKVAVAMSGGVDSSAAAALLSAQNFDCIGIFMKFWSEGESDAENKCCSLSAATDARRVAARLGMPFYVVNFKQSFKKTVVDDFLRQYRRGLTPNPCVRCNKFIKFDLLLKKARALGCDFLATGHYIRIGNRESGIQKLYQAKDDKKDQSYFLYNLKQPQLKHLLFPLGGLMKSEVRALAKEFDLHVHEKSDSQEICFVPDKDHYPFLRRHLNLKPGKIIDTSGNVVGRHDGLPLYTLGQRKGIKVGGIGPFYVVRLDYRRNVLVVSKNENDPLMFADKFRISQISWVSGKPPKNTSQLRVRIRHQGKLYPASLAKNIVKLSKSARAVMPGQSAVFYSGKELLGGGVISAVMH